MAFVRPTFGWWVKGVAAAVVSSNNYWSQQATCLTLLCSSASRKTEFDILCFVQFCPHFLLWLSFYLFPQEANIWSNIRLNEKALIIVLGQKRLLQRPKAPSKTRGNVFKRLPICSFIFGPLFGLILGDCIYAHIQYLICKKKLICRGRPKFRHLSCLLCSASFLCILPLASCISNRRTLEEALMPNWRLHGIKLRAICAAAAISVCH